MLRSVRNVLRPENYHGHGKKPPFFEGWYYKLVDETGQHRLAIIPGMFLSEDPEQHHAFIQVLDGSTGRSTYHRYPSDAFWAARDRFALCIGPNRFTEKELALEIEDRETVIRGRVVFRDLKSWPITLRSPGIMGWYAWVPFMETYHGVVSLDHVIEGTLEVNHQVIDLDGGRGYTEKDWGRSFPAAWVWLQTNHFGCVGTSLTASVAIIPWLGGSFPGFIIGFWHEGVLYRFATYSRARIQVLDVSDQGLQWIISDRRYRLEIRATNAEGALLQAPTTVSMGRRIAETLSASVHVSLSQQEGDRSGLVFEGIGRYAGLEAVGELEQLRAMVG